MKLPLKAITRFARSPQGQKAIRDARAKLDTPENRRKATEALGRLRGGGSPGGGKPQPKR